jgi:RNA polymerase sigma factor (sigma-70 family)
MYGMCRKQLNNEDDALSVLNQGFLKVFLKIDTFKGTGSLEGWIRRIIYHTMIEHLRKQKKYLSLLSFDETTPKGFQSNTLSELFREDVIHLLEKVPKMSRKVFELYAIQGYNHREIGELLGISDNTSKWHLSNARSILKDELKHQEIINTPNHQYEQKSTK